MHGNVLIFAHSYNHICQTQGEKVVAWLDSPAVSGWPCNALVGCSSLLAPGGSRECHYHGDAHVLLYITWQPLMCVYICLFFPGASFWPLMAAAAHLPSRPLLSVHPAGTAMGSSSRPAYANLFLWWWERIIVFTEELKQLTLQILLWIRFIDDIFYREIFEEFVK